MECKTNIGLEIHIQLKTKSKMFCGCNNNAEGKEPNTVVCPVCAGLPGVLPVANKQAIEWTIKTALALNCEIANYSKFDRKHYFYPDLPKNYQISQTNLPFAQKGFFEQVRIRKIHLEEDAAKLVHPEGADYFDPPNGGEKKGSYSLVDFNRAGTPLMEIVTEPDITSPSEAKLFLQQLRTLMRYLEVSDADMEKGHLRCDANISVAEIRNPKSAIRRISQSEPIRKLGTPVEIKNINSFKMVEKALIYEQERQKKLLQEGEKITRETRGWVDEKGITASQRTKEEVHDYRYFPEPDIPPFKFSSKFIKDLHHSLPELPGRREKRFIKELKLNEKDAKNLVENRLLADYFEEVVSQKVEPKKAANWVLVEMLGRLNKKGLDINKNRVLPSDLASLIRKIDEGQITGTMAKDIFEEMFETGRSPDDIIKEKGIKILVDQKQVERAVDKVIQENPRVVEDYKKGKTTVLQFFIGQVMKETKGQANPVLVKKLLEDKLNGQN